MESRSQSGSGRPVTDALGLFVEFADFRRDLGTAVSTTLFDQ